MRKIVLKTKRRGLEVFIAATVDEDKIQTHGMFLSENGARGALNRL